MRTNSRSFRRLVRAVLGWVFIVLGVLGLFLPILQGILFLCIGIWLLSTVSARVRLMRVRLGARYPVFRRHYDASRAWVRNRVAQWRNRKSRT